MHQKLSTLYGKNFTKIIQAHEKVFLKHRERFHGFYLVHFFEDDKTLTCFQNIKMPYKIILVPNVSVDTAKDTDKDAYKVISEFTALPFGENSIDCIFIINSHEIHPQLLTNIFRECSRVIRPNGIFTVTGINIFSLLGIKISIKNFFSKGSIKLYTPHSVVKWLELLGFETEELCLYNLKGDEYAGVTNPLYTVIAKKMVSPLTPIRPKWAIAESILQTNKVTNTSREV